MSCDIPFSSQLVQKAEEYFEAARPFFGGREQEIEKGLHSAATRSASA